MDGKPLILKKARDSYLVKDNSESKGGLTLSPSGVILPTTCGSPAFNDQSGGSYQATSGHMTDLFTGSPTEGGELRTPTNAGTTAYESQVPAKKIVSKTSRNPSQTEDGLAIQPQRPFRQPTTVPLSAEERDLLYSTPVRKSATVLSESEDEDVSVPTLPRSYRVSDASSDGDLCHQLSAETNTSSAVLNATRKPVAIGSGEQSNSVCTHTHTHPNSPVPLNETQHHDCASGPADAQASTQEIAGKAVFTVPDSDFVPQPPYFRRLDYTQSIDATGTPRVTSDGFHSASRSGEELRPFVVAQPYTPEKPTQMVRYTRGVVVTVGVSGGCPCADGDAPGNQSLTVHYSPHGDAPLPISPRLEQPAGSASVLYKNTVSSGPLEDAPMQRPLTRGSVLEEAATGLASPLLQHCISHSMASLQRLRGEKASSGNDGSDSLHNDDTASSVHADGSLPQQRPIDKAGLDDSSMMDSVDGDGHRCPYLATATPMETAANGVTPRISAREEVLPVPVEATRTSIRRSWSNHSSDLAINLSGSSKSSGGNRIHERHNSAVPVLTSREEKLPSSSEVPNRATSGSCGCTENGTPAHTASPGTTGGDDSSDAIRHDSINRTVCSNKSRISGTSQSPSPRGGPECRCVDRTAEGKSLSAVEEDRYPVRMRLTISGQRLDFESDDEQPLHEEPQQPEEALSSITRTALSSTVSVPTGDVDLLFREAEAAYLQLLTEYRTELVASLTTRSVTTEWMPREFAVIVDGSVAQASTKHVERPPPLCLRATEGSPQSPRSFASPRGGAFQRSPGSLSISARSGTFVSPTVMSPATATKFWLHSEEISLPPPPPPPAMTNPQRQATNSGSFVPLSLGSAARSPGVDSLIADDGAAAKEWALPKCSPLHMLFDLFCQEEEEEESGAVAVTAYLDAYLSACMACHDRLTTHSMFNYGYVEFVAKQQLVALEHLQRRHLCMQRDLFIRDKIELFVLLAPTTAPMTASSFVSQVKSSLTQFRKRLLLGAEGKNGSPPNGKERCSARRASEPLGPVKHAPRQQPERSTEPTGRRGSAPSPHHVRPSIVAGGDTCRLGKTSVQSASRAPSSRPTESCEPCGNRKSPSTAAAAATARATSARSGTSCGSNTKADAPARRGRSSRRPSYGRDVSNSRVVHLPSIEIAGKAAPALRARERQLPRQILADAQAGGPATPVDDQFMDLANCRNF